MGWPKVLIVFAKELQSGLKKRDYQKHSNKNYGFVPILIFPTGLEISIWQQTLPNTLQKIWA